MEKELKKILSILIAMMLSVSLMACGKAADSQTQTKEEDNLLSGKHHVTITVQDYGDINVPDCRVKEAVEAGLISRRRYTSYVEIYDEVKNKKKY